MKLSSFAIALALILEGASLAWATSQTCASQPEHRASFIAGNWKMNPSSVEEATSLASGVVEAAKNAPGDIAVFVPFPYIASVGEVLKGSNVKLGAQDVFTKPSGAYTGAVSMGMLKSMGVDFVLAGHSERRTVFGDSDEDVNQKVRAILDGGLGVILCIGETREENELHLNKQVCSTQLAKALKGVSEEELSRVVIAYEPVWAIGTGLTCPCHTAQDVHASIRSWVAGAYSEEAAAAMRIQYGGSVTPETVDDMMCQEDIDGALVGGASLVPNKFDRILNYHPKE